MNFEEQSDRHHYRLLIPVFDIASESGTGMLHIGSTEQRFSGQIVTPVLEA